MKTRTKNNIKCIGLLVLIGGCLIVVGMSIGCVIQSTVDRDGLVYQNWIDYCPKDEIIRTHSSRTNNRVVIMNEETYEDLINNR